MAAGFPDVGTQVGLDTVATVSLAARRVPAEKHLPNWQATELLTDSSQGTFQSLYQASKVGSFHLRKGDCQWDQRLAVANEYNQSASIQ
jgi:hypothetical protein